MKLTNTLACVLVSHADRLLLKPFIESWNKLDSGMKLVALVDIDSEPFDTEGLTTYPLVWDKDRDKPLANGVAMSLLNAAEEENAEAVIKLDVDCIHNKMDWLTPYVDDYEVVGFTHTLNDAYFFGAAYYMTLESLTRVTKFLLKQDVWDRPEDLGMAKAVQQLDISCHRSAMGKLFCGCSANVEFETYAYLNYSINHAGQFGKDTLGRARVLFLMNRINKLKREREEQ